MQEQERQTDRPSVRLSAGPPGTPRWGRDGNQGQEGRREGHMGPCLSLGPPLGAAGAELGPFRLRARRDWQSRRGGSSRGGSDREQRLIFYQRTAPGHFSAGLGDQGPVGRRTCVSGAAFLQQTCHLSKNTNAEKKVISRRHALTFPDTLEVSQLLFGTRHSFSCLVLIECTFQKQHLC